MALTMIDAPPLGAVAQGVAGLWAIEAQGFSTDGNLLLVKVVYSDDAFPSIPTRTAFWTYDLALGQYGACINDLIASDRSIEVTDVSIENFGGQIQLVATYHDTGASSGLDFNKLALIRNGVLLESDLVAHVSGSQADASISAVKVTANGRFVAVETSASNLVADLDTNGSKDIYVFDLELNSSRRVTTINGAEPALDSVLGDVMVGLDGGLSVTFHSDQAFTTQDANATTDVFVWHLPSGQFGSTAAGTIDLVSRTAAGAAGGTNSLLNLNGVVFDSESGSFSGTDLNSANDVWQSGGTSVVPVALGATGALALQTTLGSSSDGGRYVAVVTASPEIAGPNGVDQLVVVDTVLQTYVTISQSATAVLADDAVISPVISSNGGRVAFSSQASNLGTGPADGLMHLYVSALAGAPDITEGGKTAQFLAYSWKAHTLLDGVSITAGTTPVNQTTDTSGSSNFIGMTDSSLPLTAARTPPISEASLTNSAVNLQDAIAILKMIVGLDVNGAGKPLSPYQAFAADYDGNGTVGLTDAIGVLKHVVGLPSPAPAWLLFNEADATIPGKSLSAPGALTALIANLTGTTAQVHVGLVGVLRGDVDGSFAGAAGAQDLDTTQPTYFQSLTTSTGLNLSQFGIYGA